jgi:hypothetical protein
LGDAIFSVAVLLVLKEFGRFSMLRDAVAADNFCKTLNHADVSTVSRIGGEKMRFRGIVGAVEDWESNVRMLKPH